MISVIIPVYNEEKILQKTIESYKKYPVEVIVVVNNSNDKSYEIAKKYADKALNLAGIGVCAARNEGVKISSNNILIFSDADSVISPGGVNEIEKNVKEGTIGTILGKGDTDSFKGKVFFFYKNWTHRLRIYEGVIDGVFFCHKGIFKKAGGFNPKIKIAEFEDFIKRAKKNGAKYKLLTNCYAITSLRRYEEKGYLKTHFFWLKYKLLSLFKKEKDLAEEYFEND